MSFSLSARRGAGPAMALLAITLLAGLLRLHGVDAEGLSYDETSTWRTAMQPWPEVPRMLLKSEVTPPLYFTLMHFWMRAAGASELAFRWPSVLMGTLAVPLLARMAGQLLGRRVGQAAALLLAVAPTHVWYSQEARAYALYTALVLASTWALAVGWLRPKWGPWLAYAALTTAMLYTHYFAAYFLAAQALAVGWAALSARRAGRDLRRPLAWLASALGVGLLYSLWLPSFLRHRLVLGEWIGLRLGPMSPLGQLEYTLTPLLFGRGGALPGAWLALGYGAVIALLAAALWPRRPAEAPTRAPGAAVLALGALAPPFMALGVSEWIVASLVMRYILPVLPFVLALVARGAVRLRPRLALAALALVACTQMVLLVRNLAQPIRTDWRSASAYILARAQPGDVLLVEPDWTYNALSYYTYPNLPMVFKLEDLDGFTRAWHVNSLGANTALGPPMAARYPRLDSTSYRGIHEVSLYELGGN
jgi:hypothetical protein